MTTLPTKRLSIYRKFQKELIEKRVLKWFATPERLKDAAANGIGATQFQVKTKKRRLWFHAASVGELESLWSVISEFAESESEIILSVFSESANVHVQRLARSISHKSAKVLYAGYSPWEGGWQDALEKTNPDGFITSKYEAWPELWASLGMAGIPLFIVGAKERSSLRIAKRICQVLGAPLPRMHLLTQTEKSCAELVRLFPSAEVQCESDPRWDRVAQRASQMNERVGELKKTFSQLPRPWGVFGSAWSTDILFWKTAGPPPSSGTLWIVPHKVDSKSLVEIEVLLKDWGLTPVRSSHGTRISGQSCVVVDEMGFLSELYSLADWAFVGGGFGAGVHSTIEPAIQGIPVACGPNGASKFDEIEELRRTSQLKLVNTSQELLKWVSEAVQEDLTSRDQWRAQARARLGVAARVLKFILDRN